LETGFSLYANENECVDIDFELPDTVYAGVGDFAEGYFELINCGDEPATIMLSLGIELSIFDTTFTIGDIPVELGAGESISREFCFPIPGFVPSGTYGLCITAINEHFAPGSGSEFGLSNVMNYPNPFNPSSRIAFSLEYPTPVTVSVYNILGQRVITLLDENLDAGPHSVTWNGTDDDGKTVASGVYFYRVETKDGAVNKKMILMQ
jgi:hypothetical protein